MCRSRGPSRQRRGHEREHAHRPGLPGLQQVGQAGSRGAAAAERMGGRQQIGAMAALGAGAGPAQGYRAQLVEAAHEAGVAGEGPGGRRRLAALPGFGSRQRRRQSQLELVGQSGQSGPRRGGAGHALGVDPVVNLAQPAGQFGPAQLAGQQGVPQPFLRFRLEQAESSTHSSRSTKSALSVSSASDDRSKNLSGRLTPKKPKKAPCRRQM